MITKPVLNYYTNVRKLVAEPAQNPRRNSILDLYIYTNCHNLKLEFKLDSLSSGVPFYLNATTESCIIFSSSVVNRVTLPLSVVAVETEIYVNRRLEYLHRVDKGTSWRLLNSGSVNFLLRSRYVFILARSVTGRSSLSVSL